MLTAELVDASLRNGSLSLVQPNPRRQKWIELLAEDTARILSSHVGKARKGLSLELRTADDFGAPPKLKKAIQKLSLDRAVFNEQDSAPLLELRRVVFLASTKARRTAPLRYSRQEVLESVSAELGLPPSEIETRLYSDLPEEATLVSFAPIEGIHETLRQAQEEAVLLRAVSVTIDLIASSQEIYRQIFRELKFRGLLYRLSPYVPPEESAKAPAFAYRITVDGPFSLFESVSKYGLELALFSRVLPLADAYSLTAMVSWGIEKKSVVYRAQGKKGAQSGGAPSVDAELEKLTAQLREKLPDYYRIDSNPKLVKLRQGAVLVPDLSIVDTRTRKCVHIERIGFWSRAALWQRIEWANAGELPSPFLFVGNARLRVSEENIDKESTSASIYMHKGVPNAKTISERVQELFGT